MNERKFDGHHTIAAALMRDRAGRQAFLRQKEADMAETAAEFAKREYRLRRRLRAKHHHRTKFQMIALLRIQELESLFMYRYRQTGGRELPDDDAGHGDLVVMLHHLAQTGDGAREAMLAWTRRWAPWCDSEPLVNSIPLDPRKWTAAELAEELNVDIHERWALGLTLIGAVGFSPAQLKEMDRQVRVKRQRLKRRAAGVKPKSKSLSKLKPWLAEGVSRRTWYRRHKLASETK
jgi:hypothetical protein